MFTSITALFEAIKEMFGWRTSINNNKANIEVVNDKKCLKKSTNYAEKIFDITDNYVKYFTEKDLRKYKSLKRKFNRFN